MEINKVEKTNSTILSTESVRSLIDDFEVSDDDQLVLENLFYINNKKLTHLANMDKNLCSSLKYKARQTELINSFEHRLATLDTGNEGERTYLETMIHFAGLENGGFVCMRINSVLRNLETK